MKWYRLSIDLIQKLREVTYLDGQFDPQEWSQSDVRELEKIARFLRREMGYDEKD